MMKRLLLLICTTICAVNIYAQDSTLTDIYYDDQQYFNPEMEPFPHEVTIGYGIFSVNDMYGIMDNLFPSLAEMGVAATRATGSISLGYSYELRNNLALGLLFSYSGNMSNNVNDRGSLYKNYYSIMPQVKYEWFRHKKITLYSRAAVGLLLVTIKDTSGSPDSVSGKTAASVAFQLSPIGFEVGRSLAFFAEAGFGATGIITIGVKKVF